MSRGAGTLVSSGPIAFWSPTNKLENVLVTRSEGSKVGACTQPAACMPAIVPVAPSSHSVLCIPLPDS